MGLVIICVLLVAALGGIIAYYTITINDKNNQLNTVNGQLNNLKSFIATNWTSGNSTADVNTIISDLNKTINDIILYSTTDVVELNANITTLNGLLNLADSATWINNETVSEPAAGQGIAWHDWTFPASYAGYVTISVSSASPDSWAHAEYSAYGLNYNNETNVGTNGTATFPILPSNVTVGVGNGNLGGGATQTVTITYYY